MVQPTLDTLQPSLEAMTPVLDELIEQLEASMKGSGEEKIVIKIELQLNNILQILKIDIW